LNFIPAAKFKTISLGLFLHQELRADLAAATALLPAVLERGSRRYPDNLTLRRELERLYGAELSTDIHKKGERHLVSCSMEMVHGKYVGENDGLLRKGMAILAGVVGDPLVENGGFKKDYVAQEKDQLGKEIRSLINDKALYALEQCVAAMCAGERYGVFKLGRIEDLERIDPVSLWGYYRELIAAGPMDLYVVGELERGQVLEAAREAFAFDRRPRPDGIPETVVYHDVTEVKMREEKMPVGQAKLALGYRTNIAYRDPLSPALLVYNGVLGAFAHSKLFLNVREKAGLAYYIYSRLERHKGLMLVAAGIEGGNYRKTLAIIEKQVEAMAKGEISDLEMENTRRTLVNHLRTLEDNPYQMINFHLDGAIGGKSYTTGEIIRGIENVGLEEIRAVAGRIALDTVYLLQGEGPAEEGGAAAS
jgi:predicted Zn-dependent peptidase